MLTLISKMMMMKIMMMMTNPPELKFVIRISIKYVVLIIVFLI